MSIKYQMAASAFWMITGSVLNVISSIVVFVALSRLLSPEQLGIVTFAMIFIEFSHILVTAGIPDSLIQRKSWDDDVASTAFWTSLLISVTVSLILVVIGSLYSDGWDNDDFGEVLGALSILLLIQSASTVHTAKLRREFRYKVIALRGLVANVIAGFIGVALAYLGYGVWALVVSSFVSSGTKSVMLWALSGWRPRFTFSWAHVQSFGSLSVHLLGTELIGKANAQVPSLLIGFVLGPAALAQYRIGVRALDMIISLVIRPIQSTALSAFSQLAGNGGDLSTAFRRVTGICGFLACPIFFGAAAVGPDFVRIVFGPNWTEGGKVMVVNGLMVGPFVLLYFFIPALTAMHKGNLVFRESTIILIGNFLVSALTVNFGPMAVAAGLVARNHFTAPHSLRVLQLGAGIDVWGAMRSVLPSYLAGLTMAIALVVFRYSIMSEYSAIVRLCILVLIGPLIYFGTMFIFAKKSLSTQLNELRPLLVKISILNRL